jgi:hypothetical protein
VEDALDEDGFVLQRRLTVTRLPDDATEVCAGRREVLL